MFRSAEGEWDGIMGDLIRGDIDISLGKGTNKRKFQVKDISLLALSHEWFERKTMGPKLVGGIGSVGTRYKGEIPWVMIQRTRGKSCGIQFLGWV